MLTAIWHETEVDGEKFMFPILASSGDPDKALTAYMAGAVAQQYGGTPVVDTPPYSFKKKKE